MLGISIRYVDYLIRDRQLPTRRIGRRQLIPLTGIRTFSARDHRTPKT